jgi:hypothetical protein
MQSAAERSERFMLRRALLFVNPLSGKGKSKKCLLDIIRVFTEAGYSVRVYPTTPSREANIRFVQKNAKYNSLIVAIGGDGTLNELINGVMLSRIGAKIGFIRRPRRTKKPLAIAGEADRNATSGHSGRGDCAKRCRFHFPPPVAQKPTNCIIRQKIACQKGWFALYLWGRFQQFRRQGSA